MKTLKWRIALIWLLVATVGCNAINRSNVSDQEAGLKSAIDRDDPAAVAAALTHGAKANSLVAGGTALGYAVGTFRARAARALIEYGADPNRRDPAGDTAVSLAVEAYARQPALLQIVLAAGGDPNTRRRDGSPVVVRFISAHDLDALERMKEAGADLSLIERDDTPMIVNTAFAGDWDVVLKMLELGVDPRRPDIRDGLTFILKSPSVPASDSPLYPAKVAVSSRLRLAGLDVPPLPTATAP